VVIADAVTGLVVLSVGVVEASIIGNGDFVL
jgi:hypothetical protein